MRSEQQFRTKESVLPTPTLIIYNQYQVSGLAPLTSLRGSNKAKVKQSNVRWQADKGEATGGAG